MWKLLPLHHVYLRGGCLHQRLQQAKHPHQRDSSGEGGPHCHWNQWSGKGLAASHAHVSRQLFMIICFSVCKCYTCFMLMCVFFLDLREGFHLGNPAGPTGCSRWGGAGVRAWALLCSCSRLQLCLEVEDQRRSPGDKIEATALSSHWAQCDLNRCTCGHLLNCLNVRGPCFHEG